MPKSKSNRSNFVALLFMNQVLYYVSSVFYLPGLTDVTKDMHASTTQTQFAVTCLLFGFAAATFISGYLSDVLSRKKIIIGFPPFYMIGILLCVCTDNIYLFLLGVFLFGFAAGGASIVTQILSHDLSPKNPSTVIAFASSFSCFFSAVALVTAGYFAHHGHWRGIFYIMFFYSFCLFCVALFFKDKKKQKLKKPQLNQLLKNYFKIIKNNKFIIFALPYALANSGIFIFYTISPFLLINDLHISQKTYGFLMLIPVFANMAGNSLMGFISTHLKADTSQLIAEILIFIGALLMLIFVDFFQISAWEVIAPMALYMMGYGIISPALKSDVMVMFNLIAGSAVALTTLTSNVVSASSTYFVAHFLSEYLGACLLAISLVIFLTHYLGYRYRKKHKIKL